MSSEWVLPGVVFDPGWSGSERVIHTGLLDYFRRTYPHATIESEVTWPVGRPDLVLTTEILPGFRTVAIIEIKRDRASQSTVRQVARYYWHRVDVARSEPGHTEVVAIVCAPWLSPEVELSPWLMYLPVVEMRPGFPGADAA